MKKLTNPRLFTSMMAALGFFAMLSLSSCGGGGQTEQDAEKTEEAAPAEETEAAVDTTGHDGHEHEGHDHEAEDAEGGDEHPSGGSEHPN